MGGGEFCSECMADKGNQLCVIFMGRLLAPIFVMIVSFWTGYSQECDKNVSISYSYMRLRCAEGIQQEKKMILVFFP